ncbi:MAG TPA: hypothetical protein VMV18_09785, partial [bacterium]|nr:hypothetical protein [bacterium]
TLAGLDVVRTVYAGSDGYWARVIDTFTNNTGAEIDLPVEYDTNLGSGGNGTLELRDNGAAAVTYDTSTGDPNFAQVIFTAGTNNMAPFDSTWDWRYDIAVPAGQSVSLAQFWVLGDASVPAYSPMVEALVDQITTSVRTQGQSSPFMEGVSAAQYGGLSNLN